MTASALTVGDRGLPPGPAGSWLLGNLAALRADPLDLFLQTAIAHGGLARIRVAHLSAYVVSEPELIKQILVGRMRRYAKGVSYESLRHLLGDGLLVAEGELWRRQRRLTQPAFHKKALEAKLPTLAECVERTCRRFDAHVERGEAFDLVAEMMRLALDVVGATLMGAEIADAIDTIEEVTGEASGWVYRHMQAPIKLPPWVPTPGNIRFRRAIRVLDGVVHRTIDAHRRGEGGDTMLARLMAAVDDESGDRMSDRQLRDEVMTFILAGHETTGSSLAWTWSLLGRNPEAMDRLGEEVDAVLARDEVPDAAALGKLVYTGQVIDEAMRLYPPAWSFTRTATEEDELGGYRIPQGAMIVISPWVNHHHPRFWQSPERFDPSRFEPAAVAARGHYEYFPFGGGPHMCIGKHLTLLEVRLAMAMLARRYRIELQDPSPPAMDPSVSLRPRDPMFVRAHRRGER